MTRSGGLLLAFVLARGATAAAPGLASSSARQPPGGPKQATTGPTVPRLLPAELTAPRQNAETKRSEAAEAHALDALSATANRLADLHAALDKEVHGLDKLITAAQRLLGGWAGGWLRAAMIAAALAGCCLLGLVLAFQILLFRRLAQALAPAAPSPAASPAGPGETGAATGPGKAGAATETAEVGAAAGAGKAGAVAGQLAVLAAGSESEALASDLLLRAELAACGSLAASGAAEAARGAANLLAQIRQRVARLAPLAGSDTSDTAERGSTLPVSAIPTLAALAAIEHTVAATISTLAPAGSAQPAAQASLGAAAESAAAQVGELAHLRQELAALACGDITGSDMPMAECAAATSSHLTAIASRLADLDKVSRLLAQDGAALPVAKTASAALSLLGQVRQWLQTPALSFEGATRRLNQLAENLVGTWQLAGSLDPALTHQQPDSGPAELLGEVQGALRQRAGLAAECQKVMERLAAKSVEVEAVATALGPLQRGAGSLAEAVTRLCRESAVSRAEISQLRDGVAEVLPATAGEPLRDHLGRLVAAHRSLGVEHEAGKELTQTLLGCLRFRPLGDAPGDGAPQRLAVVRAEQEAPHWQLRLGLLAALPALDRELAAVRAAGRQDVIAALRLERARRELADVQAGLEGTPAHDLWKRYLLRGFAQDWLHDLLRAEALLAAYFKEQPLLGGLRDAVSLASAALRQALARFDARVLEVELLAPAPALPAREMETLFGAPDDLRRIPEVKARVARHRERSSDRLVVDLRSFLWHEGAVACGCCRVIALNPVEWD